MNDTSEIPPTYAQVLKKIPLEELEAVIAKAVADKIGIMTGCNISSFTEPLVGGTVEIQLSLNDATPSPFD